MVQERPHILSIHPTMHCDYNCAGCYLKKDINKNEKERDFGFFAKLVKMSKKVGMKEIAVPMNYSKQSKDEDTNWHYYNLFHRVVCFEEKMDFSMTANWEFFHKYWDNIADDVKDINLISVSMNDFVTSKEEEKKKCLWIMESLKERGVRTVNCNVLLSDRMVKLLKEGLAQEILKVADSIYLLTSKPLRIPLVKSGEWYSQLADILPLDSERVLMDTCIKYSFGLTSDVCDRHKMIYVNPYGEVKMCSFDNRNLVTLKEPEEFEEVYNKYFPMNCQSSCNLMKI